jgi:hypothetical protein
MYLMVPVYVPQASCFLPEIAVLLPLFTVTKS